MARLPIRIILYNVRITYSEFRSILSIVFKENIVKNYNVEHTKCQ